MGESSAAEISVLGAESESFSVQRAGGRTQIRWDGEARDSSSLAANATGPLHVERSRRLRSVVDAVDYWLYI
jgi:hypothetical protein